MAGSVSAIRAGRAMVEVGTQNEALAVGLQRAKAQLRTFQRSVIRLNSAAARAAAAAVPASLLKLGSQFSDQFIRGLKRVESAMKDFGQRMQKIGTGLIKASLFTAIPLGLSSRTFAQFESQMARVQALTNATGSEFLRLANQAKRLGETTVFTATQAAEAMDTFALAGFGVGEIFDAIAPTLNLAAAGQLSMAEASQIAVRVMAGMGIEAKNVGSAIDVLTKAMTTANTNLLQLGEAFSFVGPTARTAGIEFEEVTAAIQILSNAGIQSEKAGTTLRTGFLSLTSPSKEAKRELDKLGVTIADAAGNTKPLVNIIGDLERGLANLGTAQKLGALGRIFNARQAQGFAALVNAGSQQLAQFTNRLKRAAGEAERIANIQLNTLSGTMIILKSATQSLGIEIGEALVGVLRVATAELTKLVIRMTKWVKENKVAIVAVAALTLATAALGAGFFSLSLAIKAAAFSISGFVSLLSVANAAFLVMKSAVIGVAFAVKLLSSVLAVTKISLIALSAASVLLRVAIASVTLAAFSAKTAFIGLAASLGLVKVSAFALSFIIPILGSTLLAAKAALVGLRAAAIAATAALSGLRLSVLLAKAANIIWIASAALVITAHHLWIAAISATKTAMIVFTSAVFAMRTAILSTVASITAARIAVLAFIKTMTLAKAASLGLAGATAVLRVAFIAALGAIAAAGAALKIVKLSMLLSVAAAGLLKAAMLGIASSAIIAKVATLGLAATIGILKGVFSLAAILIGGFTVALAAIPVIIASIGIVSLFTSGKVSSAFSALASGIKETVSEISVAFKQLYKSTQGVISGISDALATGDMRLAARILFKGLQITFTTGVGILHRIWIKAWSGIERVGVEVWAAMEGAWREFRQSFESEFPNFTASIAKIWTTLVFVLRNAWAKFTNFVEARFARIKIATGDTESTNKVFKAVKNIKVSPRQENFLTERILELLQSGESVEDVTRIIRGMGVAIGGEEGQKKFEEELRKAFPSLSTELFREELDAIGDDFSKAIEETDRKAARTPEEVAKEQAAEDEAAKKKLDAKIRAIEEKRNKKLLESGKQNAEELEKLNLELLFLRGVAKIKKANKEYQDLIRRIQQEQDTRNAAVAEEIDVARDAASVIGTFNPSAIRGITGGDSRLIQIGIEQRDLLKIIARQGRRPGFI